MQPETQKFKTILIENDHFVTEARLRLFTILQGRPALTMQELIGLFRDHDPVTVYRNIGLFEKLGVINRLRLGWSTKIELSDIFRHHHHHFTCVHCGKVINLPNNKTIEKEIEKLGNSREFKAMDHQLEIRGLCSTCQSQS